ncbi:YqjF family protein [Streptomyces sp. V1I1]|uniref:YqjF family protein n=1 Tax=Streptomyces sp. V1I1 TaxID=3042272 RepID=UPI00277DC702|nr:DUF2071 domain-containing protein [Streptomyces sp. V1I1]MDQ0938514.1 uncharacterized protein YqjF (DUF2071 family) [Streptomyces sp. V1I1]
MRSAALTARWLRQTFVHWPYPTEEVQALLPAGLRVDDYHGRAWVGLTPFVMASVRLGGVAPLPRSTFPETNLRTYVRLPDGRSGLWFLSLDVTHPLMLAARALGVPYHLADLTVRVDGPLVHYAGRRRGAGASYQLTVETGPPISADEFDRWLTSRWRAFSLRAGTLWQTPVRHQPWPFARVILVQLQQTLTSDAGLSSPATDPVVHYSPGVGPARIGMPRPVAASVFR